MRPTAASTPEPAGPARPAEIRVEIGTLVVPATSLADATRTATELRRQLEALLAEALAAGGLQPGHQRLVVDRAGNGDLAAAVHRAILSAGGAAGEGRP